MRISNSKTLSNGVTYSNVDFQSELEDQDRNNCSVRALATAFEKPYEVAFTCAEMIWDRKKNQGARGFGVEKTANMGWLWDKKITRMGAEVRDKWNFSDANRLMFGGDKMLGKWGYKSDGWGGTKKVFRRMSTGTFFKTFTKGTYIIVVRGHMFTYKDGQVLGNYSDAEKTKTVIEYAFAVGREANKMNDAYREQNEK